MNDAKKNFIDTHPDSYATLDIMKIYFNWGGPFTDAKEAQRIYDSLSPRLKNSYEGKADRQRIQLAKTFDVGTPAPDFTATTVDGNLVKLSDFRGKYVLVDFWFRACHPCREQMPYMKAAYEKFKDKGFVVLAVCADNPANMRAAISEDHTD